MALKKGVDGDLEIEEVKVTKISLEQIEDIIASTEAAKAEALVRIASLDESISYYTSLKTQAVALGVEHKVVAEDAVAEEPK